MSAPAPRPMKLFTQEQRAQLLANGAATLADPSHDPWPVVKLFTPDAGATWLVTEIDPDEPNRLWALCDLGLGFAEYGTVWLSEIEELRGKLGLPVERDLHFEAQGPISAYVEISGPAGRIIEWLPKLGEGGAL
jgi:hypothetical protein